MSRKLLLTTVSGTTATFTNVEKLIAINIGTLEADGSLTGAAATIAGDDSTVESLELGESFETPTLSNGTYASIEIDATATIVKVRYLK